jgi:integrase
MQPPTVADLLAFYAHEYLPVKAASTQYQYHLLHQRLLVRFGSLSLAALTPDTIRAWRDALLARYSPATVRRYLAVLRGPVTVAVREGWLAVNPFALVRLPALPPARVRWLTAEQRTRLLAACQASHQPALYPLVVLALQTGGRKNEVRTLRWEAVDLDRGLLRFERTKNKQTRVVPLVGLGQVVLADWQQRRRRVPWVFPRADGAQPIDVVYAWMKARAIAGLPDFHFHDLRHTCASYLAMSGSSLLEIAEILGHKQLEQSRRYSHLSDSHVRAVVARMAAQFLTEEG